MAKGNSRAVAMRDFQGVIAERRADVAGALPKHIPVERFERVVMTAIQNNLQLLDAPPRELFNACVKAATDGLLPDGREGALVCRPSRNGITVTWQPMIAGIRKKVRNSGEIATWDVQAVYANDAFEFELGDDPYIKHRPALTNRGALIAVYSVATLKSGEKSRDVMSIEDVHAIRDRSDAWRAFKAGKIRSTPWSTDEAEMAKKTVARRHAKVLPMSTDLDDLIRRDDELYSFAERGAQPVAAERATGLSARLDALAGPSELIDGETGEVIDGNAAAAAEPDEEPAKEPAKRRVRATPREEAEADEIPGVKSREREISAAEQKAFDAGRHAYNEGQSRDEIPAVFDDDEATQAAWLNGFDTAASDDDGAAE